MDISLHAHQLEIYESPARFKAVAAGRRFGKSFLAAALLLVMGAQNTKTRSDGSVISLEGEEVYYIAPTFSQGKRIMWGELRRMGSSLIKQCWEQTGEIELVNGRRISIKGADNPDSLRGIGLSYVVLDEYADMKESVWEEIIQPCLGRAEGGALFIGTPKGKNHFFTLWSEAAGQDDWAQFSYKSNQNPHLLQTEIERMASRMSADKFRQEMEATFESGGGAVLRADMFSKSNRPYAGDVYIAADLAGYKSIDAGKKTAKLDSHAIAVVMVHPGGWHILDIIHGQWDTRETALRLVKAYRDYRPIKFGIEKGMSMNAVLPYLEDEMNRIGTYFPVEPLTHGNQKKTDRIVWALQGRAEKGRITLGEENDDDRMGTPWHRTFLEQAEDFPSHLSHDDLLDATAYIDQISEPFYEGPDVIDDWEPLDAEAGY